MSESAKVSALTAERWWKVSLGAGGKVLSCTALERAPQDEAKGGIIYVRAPSRLDAETEARALLNAYHREKQARHNAKLRADGKCRCGRPKDPDYERCSECRDKDRLYKERDRKRAKGLAVAPLDRRVALGKRRREEHEAAVKVELERALASDDATRSVRRAVLAEVHAKWLSANNNRQFSDWLSSELKKAGGAA
jgi:hypothetical protein